MGKIQQQCPLCEAVEQDELYVTCDRHYGIEGTYRIVQCRICALVFLNPMYSDAELAALYPADYYAHQTRKTSRGAKALVRHLLGLEFHTKDPEFPTPGRVLDVGCGTGWFLREMRDQGWQVHGVEINAEAARIGRQTDGLDIFRGPVQEAKFPEGFFDYVRSNHSFEHISCPNETLDEIHRILKPGGKLMIGVPNIGSTNARVFGRYWWYLGAPVHTFNYSVKTLRAMLLRHSFVLERIVFNSDFHGILGSLQIWLNRHTRRKSGEGRAIRSRLLMVACAWMAKLMDIVQAGDEIEITVSKARTA